MSLANYAATELQTLLARLETEGVALSLQGDDLAVRGNDRALGDRALVAALRANKQALVELLKAGTAIGAGPQVIIAPPNLIPPGATRITPEMLTMVSLDQRAIDAVVATVAGGAGNVQDVYPLAPLQEGMLFHHLLGGGGDVYTEGYLLGLRSRAQLERFLAAMQQVIDRHDILRTGIAWDGLDQPVQVVRRRATLAVEYVALEPRDGDIAHQLAARYDASCYRLDITQAPLIRCYASEDRAGGRWLLRVLVHHLAIDHTALELLIHEVQMIVRGERARLPEPVPFRTFVAQARHGVSERDHEAFFTRMLGDIDEPTAPFGLLDVQGDGTGIAEASHAVEPQLARAIRARARALGVSAASLFHLAWALVLARTTGRREVVFGTVLFGRSHGGADADRVLGLVMNTLPVRVSVASDGVERSLKHTHGVLAQLLRHEHAPLALAQRCSAVPAGTPLFTSLLNYRYNVESDAPDAGALPGDDDVELIGGRERTNYPLTLSVDDLGHGFALTAQMAGGVAPERICALVASALGQLVGALDVAPDRPVEQLDVLPAAERVQLAAWNATTQAYPGAPCVHELFEAQVVRGPDAVAVVDGARRISYGELNAHANQLAAHLRELGVGADVRVGLCLERSAEMVIGLLATLKAGGCYVPLDPDSPLERVRDMLDDAAPRVVLVDHVGERVLAGLAHGSPPTGVLHVTGDAARWARAPAHDVRAADGADRQLAYVIYTSGSTGRPKGVMNEHRGVVNRLRWMQDTYGLTARDVVLQKTPYSFDVSVWELYWPLMVGAQLVMAQPGGHKDPGYLSALIQSAGVTTLHFVPSMLQAFLAHEQAAHCTSIRRVVCSGETLPAVLAHSCHAALPWAELHNLYGPTEAAVDVTAWRCVPGDGRAAVPIGRPIANTQIHIVDERLRPAPIGVVGELYIGGVQVARGYLNRGALTAERFVDDPFAPGGRLYRTGDLARWLPDGTIEYLGRNDFQVKLRGFRIELGEIEARLAEVGGVRQVVVVAREDVPGDQRLVAYYAGDPTVDVDSLRAHVARALPAYMAPAAYVKLAVLPVSANGKLDRKALPAPEAGAYARGAYEPPEGAIEQRLAELWAGLLGVTQVGRRDNFFDLGGHSLIAVQLVSRVRRAFEVELSLGDLFSHPVFADMAGLVVGAARSPLQAIPVVDRSAGLALSLAQQRLWFLTQLEGASEAYHITGGVRLTGALDRDAVRRALVRIVERHEALRACYRLVDGQPVQRVIAPGELRDALVFDERDLRGAASPDDAARVLGDAHGRRRFELTRELPLRALLIRVADDRHELHVTIHHLAADGWSVGVLLHELSQLYGAFVVGQPDPLPPLAIQYADYAAWQRSHLTGRALEVQCAFWRRNLAGAPTLLELPADRARPAQPDHAGASLELMLPAGMTAQLRALSRRCGVTLYATMLASWAAVLGRLSNQPEVVIGSPVAGRSRPDIEPLIGCFVNTLALRIDLQGSPSVSELLARVMAQVLATQAHQDLPFDQVVEVVKPPRNLAHTPVFQVMVDWQSASDDELDMPGLAVTVLAADQPTAQFDLTVSLRDDEDGIAGVVSYATALFDRSTIERYVACWQTWVAALVDDDRAPIDALPVLPAAARDTQLVTWNTPRAYPHARCVHHEVELQAARTPGAIAVVHGTAQRCYGELNARANQLARYLRLRGVGADRLIAICLGRGIAMVETILAIVKAGGAYVPLDPAYASSRLGATLQDCQPTVLVIDDAGRAALGAEAIERAAAGRTTVIDLAVDAARWAALPAHDLEDVGLRPQHLMYVIYTSGSTGQPKGVMVEHAQVARLFEATQAWYEFGASDVWTLLHSIGFDFSVWELWGALRYGGRLVIVPLETARSPGELYDLVCDAGVTVLNQTPSAFHQLIAAQARSPRGHRLRTVVFGGEVLELRTLKPWYARNGEQTELVNMYGITETTVHVTYRPLRAADADRPGPSPIGVRIPDLRLYVLDAQRRPVPVGVTGELYVGGAGVARGYLNRPELTAERFIADPFVAGGRLYRTGDLGRWLVDGTVEYLGRNDLQVKIRGFRIELGEIEVRLAQVAGVREVVVVARDAAAGDRRLVAYYTTTGAAAVDAEALRAHAALGLPPYMVPSAYVTLAALPLTPNGKLDRDALPAPEAGAYAQRAHEPPQGEIEHQLAAIWAELLQVEQVGRHDNFFELGGHSLLAVQLASRLRDRIGVELALSQLFGHPVLSELASCVRGAARTPVRPIPIVARTGPLALSLAQQRLWFLTQLEGASDAYHIAGAIRVSGALDRAVLSRALSRIVERHEALRTCFRMIDGEPMQQVLPGAELAIHFVSADDDAALTSAVAAHARARFDLARELPVRVLLVALANGDHVLHVTMHHIASDGWSVAVLLAELSQLYRAFLAGAPDPLPALPVQYADYAAWQRGFLAGDELQRQGEFWRHNLAGAPTLLELPSDRARPAHQDHAGATLEVELPAELSARLHAVSRRHGATVYMTLLASWAAVLGRLASQDEVVVGSPVAGRTRAEIEPLIGFFVNTLALRIDLGGEPTVADLIARTKAQVLAAQAHQDLPFDQVVELVRPPRTLAHSAVFQVMFDWQPAPGAGLELPGLELAMLDEDQASSHFDVTLALRDGEAGIAGVITYATALFDRPTIERYLGYWRSLLEGFVAADDQIIARIPVLDPVERTRLVVEWNATAGSYPDAACVHHLFEDHARRAPHGPAVTLGDEVVTYGELNARANQLARHLRLRGVGPDQLVAVDAERSIELIVSIFGVLKAGGAYVPIDLELPAQRLAEVIEDARPRVLLTRRRPDRSAIAVDEVIALVDDWADIAHHDASDLDPCSVGVTPRHLAYVIFTSGSTGRPKGVMIEHRSIVNYASHIVGQFDVASGDGALIFTSFNFDLTLTSVYPPLICGRALRLCPEGNDLARWRSDLLAASNLAPVKLTPSHLALLQQALPADQIDGRIRTLVLGGEALKGSALTWWREHAPNTRIFNHYGPTEATVGCVVNEVVGAPPGPVPIGRPITNMRAYILDRELQPVPTGVAGELYIAGVGVARGYLQRPELTRERFLPDRFVADPGDGEARMYRTGDVARWRGDGKIEYLGRRDHQVKLRGFRIELGEIEAALVAHPQVKEAFVMAREDAPGDQRLVAYLTSRGLGEPTPGDELRLHLATSLPHYMLPAAYVHLATMPLNANGKVDRGALPVPDGQPLGATRYVPPRGEAERVLARLWQQLLKLERVGRDDNFFELGGHSLLAVTLIEQMRQAGLHVDVRALFTAATLAELAAQAGGDAREVDVPANLIPAGATRITPDMVTLVSLDQTAIDAIVAGVEGGAANVQDIYPLAPLQEGMLFHHLWSETGDAYVESHLLAFRSRARLDQLLGALQAVIDRHDILRTAIAWDGLPRPVQVVRRRAPLHVEVVALELADGDVAAQLAARFDPRRTRLDVRQAPLLRCHIAQDVANGRWILSVLAHHLAVDHTTLELLVEEARAIEHGRLDQLASPAPFRNYVAQALLGVSPAEHEAYFSRALGDIDAPTAPFGLLDVQGDGSGICEARRALSPLLAAAIRGHARRLRVSPASLIHLAWALVLERTTGRRDVVFGTVLFGRMRGGARADQALGLFMNTLPLRVTIADDPIEHCLHATHAGLVELLHHEHAPLAVAQRCSGVSAPMPLFTTLLNYRYTTSDVTSPAPGGALGGDDDIELLHAIERTNYPITLAVDDLGDGFALAAQVGVAISAERVCGLMHAALEQLVAALADAPSQPARTLDVVPGAEREQVMAGWNATAVDYPRDTCLHQLFEAQVARTPDAIAVVQAGAQLSYRELNARANQLAHYLRTRGVGPDARVGLAVERDLELVVAVLGILKAGGAYVPVDPSYPADRVAYMLRHAAPVCVVTQSSLAGVLPATSAPRVMLDALRGELAACSTEDPALGVQTSSNLAYVIYTSGSSGQPKGVMIEHRNVVNFLAAMQRAPGLTARDVLLAVTSLSFDIAALELFLPLVCGARLVLATRDQAGDAEQLKQLIERHAVSVMQATPSTWRIMTAQPWSASPHLLKVLCGGEAMPVRLAEQLLHRVPELWNLYGPTETTIWSTACQLTEPAPTIGRPIANTQVYVLDTQLRPVPIGVAGELYIGGAGVARGYLDQPELTAERFITDPFTPPGQAGRIYRTGDLVRWLEDGTLEYLGRNDFQVKIRGFRIELGDIEARLAQLAGVREVVVLAREDVPGDPRLVAYYAGDPGADDLRAHVSRGLPLYMVPSAYVQLAALPLTPNGKLDRKALPAPEDEAFARRAYEPPRGGLERELARIWGELLQVEQVGRRDDFFALGGHSLLAVQLVARVRQVLDLELSLSELFEHAELAQLAVRLAGAVRATMQAIPRVERGGPLALGLAQQRLWFMAQLDVGDGAYHITGGVRLTGELDRTVLARALARIVERHEALRTRICVVDGQPMQLVVVAADAALELDEHDVRGASNPEPAARRLADAHATMRFDLARALPVRALLVRVADDVHLLYVAMHHVASDAWSVGVLLDELSQLYAAFLVGAADPLPALALQYADYAAWQRGYLTGGELEDQRAFWRDNLAGAPVVLGLPTDRPRPAEQDLAGATVDVAIGAELSQQLRALSQRHGVTVYMTLLASWAAVLARLSGQDEVVVGSPVAGRSRLELEPLIGCFVNTLALRIDLGGEPTVTELLARTRAQVLAAHAHQDLAFDQVVELVKPPRSLAHPPVFQVMLDWQNAPAGRLEMPGLALAGLDGGPAIAQFDLTLSLHDSDAGIAGGLRYATALFDRETVERQVAYWQALLVAMVADGNGVVGRLPLQDRAEREQVLIAWNATARAYAQDRCVHELVEAHAARTPGALALEQGGEQVSFGELNARANRLARHLRALGVAPDRLVAICAERGVDLVVAMLAIVKAGGAYVPIDPSYPRDRVAMMVRDAAPVAVLTQADLAAQLTASTDGAVPVVDLGVDVAWRNEPAGDLPLGKLTARHLAYVIYTSGSTGTPKGVMIEHRSLHNLVAWHLAELGLRAGSRSSSMAGVGFDATTWEIWTSLCCGGALVLPPVGAAGDAEALLAWWQAQALDVSFLVTPLAELAYASGRGNPRLGTLLVGGDRLRRWPAELADGQALINNYGPTETTVVATSGRLARDGALHIGRPIANTQVYVLDERRQPAPIGVAGELYIAGDGVARGYLNQPGLTAERFVDDPFTPGQRMYRSGDLVRWRADGTIEYLGRDDHQVKLRGFRIELGEIEAQLAQVAGVREVAVVARGADAGDTRLVAYYAGDGAVDAARLRAHATCSLPAYMVPSDYVELPALPVSANGKLDRKALPPPANAGGATRSYEPPRGELELALASTWAELLGIERVGRHDGFFELGGHSLLAVQLIARLRDGLGVELAVRDLFAAPTLAELAATVTQRVARPLPSNLTAFRRGGTSRPVFFVHPGLGEIGYVSALLPGLDPDIPVYGLSAVGFLAGEQPLRTVEDMAAAYVAAIRRVQPHGPYRIVGWCAGGNLGYEMANQLLQVGEPLEFLGMLDSPSFAPVDPSALASVLSRLPDVIPEELRARLGELAAAGDHRGMLRACQGAGLLPAELPIELLERYLATQHAIKLAKLRYVPPCLPVTITHFLAERVHDGWEMDGWTAKAAGVVCITVPGDHLTMVEPPHAESLAARLSLAIRGAAGGQEGI
jgi:amino acid adenylation domain-containing protein